MNECYYYLLFLTLFIHFQLTESSENDLPNVTIQHLCENDLLSLKCSNQTETIQIIRSMYGRTSQRICNNDLIYFGKTCANIEQSKYQTKLRCHGKSSCHVLINNNLFNDPCGRNIPKHFEIHYRCINKEEICPRLVSNCSKSNDLKCLEKILEEFSCQCPTTVCQYSTLDKNQIIGFIENSCPEENLQGFHWTQTVIQKNQSLSCPSPCTGQIFRFCNLNSQWSIPSYTNCKCPIEKSDQLSMHRSANSYVFQCNFWLINRILPKDNSCILSFTNWIGKNDDDGSLNCLLSAFEQMTFQTCLAFGIDFKNIAFEVYIPFKNERKFRLLTNLTVQDELLNEIIIDRTDVIKVNSRRNLPMMVIDTKNLYSNNTSIILIEQGNDSSLIQTANVTVIFNHKSSDSRYQCRAYRSTNFSLHLDSTNMFFACQLLCSNGSHVICQCPFFNPFMHYVLHLDTSISKNDIDYDLNGKCSEEKTDSLIKINRYISLIHQNQNFAKKLLSYIDTLIEKENFTSNWKLLHQFIQQIESIGLELINISKKFISIDNHIEFFIKFKQNYFETNDRSVLISIMNDIDYPLIFFLMKNLNINQSLNSHIVTLKTKGFISLIDNIQITFQHLKIINDSGQIPTCVYLKNNSDVQWRTEGCRLLSTNLTHSICSCNHLSTFALMMDFQKTIIKSDINRLLFISKIGCIVSIICLSFTIITLIIMRSRMNIDDDLTIARYILNTNMLLCLLIVQILFLFGIDQTKHKSACRLTSVLLDYFLLATFSWMFVDGIELLIALKHVFKVDRIRLLAYSLYSYGFPLLIVFLSLVLSTNRNNSSKYCWLSYDNAFIWAFVIPFILLIFANICFFVISICKKSNPSSDPINKLKTLRDISIISMLFGLTWIIGLVYLHNQTILFAYIFTIFNCLHGLVILMFYCLLQKNIQDLFPFYEQDQTQNISVFHRFFKITNNPNHPHKKSVEHFSLPDNTSSSGYSSAHSSDFISKQILCNRSIDLHRNCSNNETPYLPSIPINLLTSRRLSTFRYPINRTIPSNEIILSYEQNQQLLQRSQIHEDDHQYYEIG